MYFSNKKGCYQATSWKAGERLQKGKREKSLNTKPLDPSLMESRTMAADWSSIVKTNTH